jgi:hypothetical protein
LRAALVVDVGKKKYVVEVKVASEGRRDRMVPLLSQAILQAQAVARRYPELAAPLAVVAARRVPASVAEHLKHFAERYAPDVAVGVIDAAGLRSFAGPGLDGLDAKPARRVARDIISPKRPPNLFTDLNQWMLKILLGQHLPKSLISVPRSAFHSASQLAEAANVSVMSATRLVNQLADEGFLDEHRDHLQLVRADELLEQWVSANRKISRDIPARWILKKGDKQFFASVAQYASESGARRGRAPMAQQRCCIGLFAAADMLGLGFVRGALPHLYLERVDSDALQRLGLSVENSRGRADVYIRIASYKEAVFRAVVVRDGVPVSDALQVWLDASAHPARGREQANEIRRRALKPFFEKQR